MKPKPKPPRPVTLWVDEQGDPVALSAYGACKRDYTTWRVRYVPAHRGTAAALKLATRKIQEARWQVSHGCRQCFGAATVLDDALAHINKLQGRG